MHLPLPELRYAGGAVTQGDLRGTRVRPARWTRDLCGLVGNARCVSFSHSLPVLKTPWDLRERERGILKNPHGTRGTQEPADLRGTCRGPLCGLVGGTVESAGASCGTRRI